MKYGKSIMLMLVCCLCLKVQAQTLMIQTGYVLFIWNIAGSESVAVVFDSGMTQHDFPVSCTFWEFPMVFLNREEFSSETDWRQAIGLMTTAKAMGTSLQVGNVDPGTCGGDLDIWAF